MKPMKNIIKTSLLMALVFVISACEKQPKYVYVGKNWKALHQLSQQEPPFRVTAKVKKQYKVGENLTLNIFSENAGKLWVIQVDEQDKVTFISPSALIKDQMIAANETRNLPANNSPISIKATKPVGESLFAVIITTQKLNWQANGNEEQQLSELIVAIKQTSNWSANSYIVKVID